MHVISRESYTYIRHLAPKALLIFVCVCVSASRDFICMGVCVCMYIKYKYKHPINIYTPFPPELEPRVDELMPLQLLPQRLPAPPGLHPPDGLAEGQVIVFVRLLLCCVVFF